jgi:hypothetical protein
MFISDIREVITTGLCRLSKNRIGLSEKYAKTCPI